MIMIWSGWGIQVPLYVVLFFFVAMGVTTPLHLPENLASAVAFGLSGALAGGAIYFTARWIESKPGRVLIDAATQQQFEVKPSAGSFFFIPTRFWAFIAPALLIALAGLMYTSPPSSEFSTDAPPAANSTN